MRGSGTARHGLTGGGGTTPSRVHLIALVAAVGLLGTACEGPSGPGPIHTPARPDTATTTPAEDPPSKDPASPATWTCPEPLEPLSFTADTAEEHAQLGTLRGCTDNVMVTNITNVSKDQVWVVDGFHWTRPATNPKIRLYRSYVRHVAGNGLMTLEPGATANFTAPPGKVRLRLSSPVQSSWSAYALLLDTAQEKGVDLVDEAVAKQKSTGAMLYTCFRAGWEVGSDIHQSIEDPDQHLRKALGLEDEVGACAKKVNELESESARQQRQPPVEVKRLAVKTKPQSSWAARTGSVLKFAAKKVVTRGRGG